jgi:hypothetical protein
MMTSSQSSHQRLQERTMRTRSFSSLLSVGLVLATLAAPSANAQARTSVIVCRDGSRLRSIDARECARHGGVDGRATEIARRRERERENVANRRDERWGDRDDDPRHGNDGWWGNGRDDLRGATVYEWSGRVDKEVRIQLRGNRAFVQNANAADGRFARSRVMHELPRRDGRLVVERLDGRGIVDVLVQPSARNGYTATFRIRDPRGGSDNYHIVARWEPMGGYGQYGDGRYGNGQYGDGRYDGDPRYDRN